MYTLNWGIMATGGISAKFAKDLLVNPATRNVTDLTHSIAAVGSSTSRQRAQDFVREHCAGHESNIACYGSYKEFLADKNIQAVYIGTPHSEHWANARDCILAGKHVLCEKPCTVNAKQAQGLVDLAKKHNVFFMEAVWTRFFPITYKMQELIENGTIGRVRSTNAHLGMDVGLDEKDASDRLINHNLAGGSILDLGPYPWVWTAMSVLHPLVKSMKDLSKDAKLPLPQIASMIDYSGPQLTKKVGGPIDVATSAILKFPMPQLAAWEKEPGAEQSITSTIQTSFVARTTNERTVLIQGSRGDIIVPFPPFKAKAFEVRAWDTIQDKRDEKPPSFQKRFEQDFPGDISGFAYEADATARCIRDGQIECERMPWRETVLQMEIFDKIREQNGFKYPDSMEATPSA